jgi:hypothetical protein
LQPRSEPIPSLQVNVTVSDWKITDQQIVHASSVELEIWDYVNFQVSKYFNLSKSSHDITSVNKFEPTKIWQHVLADKYSIQSQLFQVCNISKKFQEIVIVIEIGTFTNPPNSTIYFV